MSHPNRHAALLAAWLPVALIAHWIPTHPALAQTLSTDSALAAAVNNPQRTPALASRDAVRHPAEELAFFGLHPDATVVEIWPGKGYWTEILGPYLAGGHGKYYVAVPGDNEDEDMSGFRGQLAKNPALAKQVTLTSLSAKSTQIAPPGSADFVLTFRNFHNWMEQGTVDQVLAAFHAALKPGGILGVEDHRGDASQPQDPKAKDGYVRQDYAIAAIEKAGFTLIGSSEINANPRDTKHYPKGVWTLPPTYELKDKDHAKYAAIGEADNFVLKFRRN